MLKTLCSCLAVVTALATIPAQGKTTVQYVPKPGSTKPFSPAVRVGDIVYVSGAVGYGADGSLPADFTTQARNTMDNVAAELKLAGATMDDVYKCQVALTNMDNWADFNTVYATYFKVGRLPVRMALGVVSLGGPAVEVQCEAALH